MKSPGWCILAELVHSWCGLKGEENIGRLKVEPNFVHRFDGFQGFIDNYFDGFWGSRVQSQIECLSEVWWGPSKRGPRTLDETMSYFYACHFM